VTDARSTADSRRNGLSAARTKRWTTDGNSGGSDAAYRLALLRWPDGGELPTGAAEVLRDALEQPLRERWQRTAKTLSQQFATVFRAAIAVELERQDRSAAGPLLQGEEPSVCLWPLEIEGSDGAIWLAMELPLTRSLLDRLLGGQLAPYHGPCGALTELEERLALRIVQACREAIQAGWPELRLAATLPEARASQPRSATDAVARGVFEIRSGALVGTLTLAIPWRNLLDVCCAGPSHVVDSPPADSEPSGVIVSAIVARARIPEGDLNRLEVGDLIPAGQGHDQLVQVVVDGRVLFLARPGEIEGRKAIRIE
jgi:flagellar motor switch protein FliM